MRTVSPVAQLLDQWLLLPLFLHLGLLLLTLRSARGRVGALLALLLSIFSLHDITCLWPGPPSGAALALSVVEAPLVALFTLGYVAGRHITGGRIWRAPLFLAPAALLLAAGWLQGWGSPHPLYLLHASIFYALAGAILYMRRSEAVLSGVEPMMVGAALTLLFVGGPLCDAALPALGLSLPLFPYASAAASALMAYLVLRYKAFGSAPMAEGAPAVRAPWALPPGVYLAGEDGVSRARELFVKAVREGVPGLLLSRTHPLRVRAETGLRRVPVVWLAHSVYERALPPSETDVILHTVRDCMEQAGELAVLIEDVDCIISCAGYFAALDLLRDIVRAVGGAGARVLLSSRLLTAEERAEILGLGIRPLP